VTGSYQINLDAAGTVHLRAGYNNTRTRIAGTVATPPQLAAYSSVLFDRIEQRRLECGQPMDSLRLGGDWQRRHAGFDVNLERFGNSTVNSFNGIETFPRHSPFGMNGRSLYARIGWKF